MEGRFVTVGPLVLFSTETGDAWLLHPADRLAARAADSYSIDGEAFVYADNESGRRVAILGYPAGHLAKLG